MPPPGITAWHDWRNGVYRELIAQAHERGHSAAAPESGDASVGTRTPLTNVFFLDSLESHDHQNDGFASEHRQLYPTDSIHYGCVARAAVPSVVERWDYQWWQCRAHHDKAHAALVVAMAVYESASTTTRPGERRVWCRRLPSCPQIVRPQPDLSFRYACTRDAASRRTQLAAR
jgi:hypothetical protein